MRKNRNPGYSDDNGRLKDGSKRIIVVLESEIADIFEEEMKISDRKAGPLVRFIVTGYLRKRLLDRDYETFTRHREDLLGPGGHHFGDLPAPRQRVVERKHPR